MARFEVFQDKQGKWRFRLKADNHKIVAASEAYSSKSNAKQGAEAINWIFGERFGQAYTSGLPVIFLD